MAISHTVEGNIVRVWFEGVVDDEQLFRFYEQRVADRWFFVDYHKELVDGRGISTLTVTFEGHEWLIDLVRQNAEILRGRRVAMLADRDLVYGVFRMWEMQQEDLDYIVRVFHDNDEAVAWLSHAGAGTDARTGKVGEHRVWQGPGRA